MDSFYMDMSGNRNKRRKDDEIRQKGREEKGNIYAQQGN